MCYYHVLVFGIALPAHLLGVEREREEREGVGERRGTRLAVRRECGVGSVQ